MGQNTIIKNVYVDDRLSSIMIQDGIIQSIARGDTPVSAGDDYKAVDGGSRIAIPALVDGHGHLDKTIMGLGRYDYDYDHSSLKGRIENELAMRAKLGHDPYTQAKRYIRLIAPLGTLFMRSHVDVDPVNRLRGMEGVLKARAEYRGVIDVQIVAFPQSGLLTAPETFGYMDDALSLGADVVGGLDPTVFDGDAKKSVKAIFDLAEKHRKPIDIHLHEEGETGLRDLGLILDAVKAYDMRGNVAISHAFCLFEHDNPDVQAAAEQLAELGVHVVTSAMWATAPLAKPLLSAGVNVAGGNDNMRDLWSPLGTGDMLERVRYIAIHNDFIADRDFQTALDMCTTNGARLLGLGAYGLAEGMPADMVLLEAESISNAAAALPAKRIVIRSGAVVEL